MGTLTAAQQKALDDQKKKDAQDQINIAAAFASVFGSSKNPTDTSTVSSTAVTIDYANAKALLQKAADSAQYQGKLSDAEINDFVAKFNAQARLQMDTVIRNVKSKATPGATAADYTKIINNEFTTNPANFFDPSKFASDFVWSKVNFGKQATLGGNALLALEGVRGAVAAYNPNSLSDAEVQQAAKDIAMGKSTIEDFKAKMSLMGQQNYPQFAARLASTPGATMLDIAQPYINTMAKELEIDPASITLDNPLLDKALRPDGTAGKVQAQSLADFTRTLRNTPEWENTTAANNQARNAATELAHAMGRGI